MPNPRQDLLLIGTSRDKKEQGSKQKGNLMLTNLHVLYVARPTLIRSISKDTLSINIPKTIKEWWKKQRKKNASRAMNEDMIVDKGIKIVDMITGIEMDRGDMIEEMIISRGKKE